MVLSNLLEFARYARGATVVVVVVEVEAVANRHGLTLEGTVEMPANNLSLIFRAKRPDPPPRGGKILTSAR